MLSQLGKLVIVNIAAPNVTFENEDRRTSVNRWLHHSVNAVMTK